MHQKANVNVYLVIVENNRVLLSLRENTGYEDGKWSLIAGNVEAGESVKQALVREAEEEVGIIIHPNDLSVLHVMHRKTDRENVDIFMSCLKWDKKIINAEPHKCGGLTYFDLNQLPENTIPYIVEVIQNLQRKSFYSEFGW